MRFSIESLHAEPGPLESKGHTPHSREEVDNEGFGLEPPAANEWVPEAGALAGGQCCHK